MEFQSTLPVREVTVYPSAMVQGSKISIHTSREGSDRDGAKMSAEEKLFQSTLPVREVTSALQNPVIPSVFQSTLPVREVTAITYKKKQ